MVGERFSLVYRLVKSVKKYLIPPPPYRFMDVKIVAGIIAVIAIAGGIGYMVMNNQSGDTETESSPSVPAADPVTYPDEIYEVRADTKGMTDAKVVELLKADSTYSEKALKLFDKFTQDSVTLNGTIDAKYAELKTIEDSSNTVFFEFDKIDYGEYATYPKADNETVIHFLNETQVTAQDLVSANEQVVINMFKENFPATAENMQRNGYDVTFDNIKNWNNCIGTYDEMVAYNSDCVSSGMQIQDLIDSQAGQTVTQNLEVLTWCKSSIDTYEGGFTSLGYNDGDIIMTNLSTINTAKADLKVAQSDYADGIIELQSAVISAALANA